MMASDDPSAAATLGTPSPSLSSSSSSNSSNKPKTIGVFGGSFNPIHLGHALLAITTQQTKAYVDEVVLVPVYKHAVKTDLLPFEDRVNMCELAIKPFGSALSVSTVEKEVGASNGAMLKGLKKHYPIGTKFVWICGDDFCRWMHKPKGLETLAEVSGLIIQRRLHKSDDDERRFYKEPIDDAKIQSVAAQMDLRVDFIYGELPHFSSTLVRRAPGHWRSFLTQSVTEYLDARPHLLQQLIANLDADVAHEKTTVASHGRTSSLIDMGPDRSVVNLGLEAVHSLQNERGYTGLRLSTGEGLKELQEAQGKTDGILKEISEAPFDENELEDFHEVKSLAAELKRIPGWLEWDRRVLQQRGVALSQMDGQEGWLARLSLVEKFNPRIDVLIGATIRALTEILEISSQRRRDRGRSSSSVNTRSEPDILFQWCEGKEALGRLRAFVSAGGPSAPSVVRKSLELRGRLIRKIGTKERRIARVLSWESGSSSSRSAAPEALHRMLEHVTEWEWLLMGCFAPSTPLPLVHRLLEKEESRIVSNDTEFDVVQFFQASSTAIDFLLSFAKALAASACARA
jgi:nicotinate (nicotinamide) nucleotide adenylyltransferase